MRLRARKRIPFSVVMYLLMRSDTWTSDNTITCEMNTLTQHCTWSQYGVWTTFWFYQREGTTTMLCLRAHKSFKDELGCLPYYIFIEKEFRLQYTSHWTSYHQRKTRTRQTLHVLLKSWVKRYSESFKYSILRGPSLLVHHWNSHANVLYGVPSRMRKRTQIYARSTRMRTRRRTTRHM
jgi:hypothetical protein